MNSVNALRLAVIPGHYADQLEIEAQVYNGETLGKHELEELPDCPQKLEYARHSYRNAMKSKNYFSGVDAAVFLPEDEMVACLEEVIKRSMVIGRHNWADNAIKAFPKIGKWNGRRKELLESVIKRHLDAGIPHWANDVAKEIPRELSSAELESVIAGCLNDDFSSAEIAIGIAKRSFTVDELRIAIKSAKRKKNWELVLKIAQMLPSSNEEECKALIDEARKIFIKKGDAGGIDKVCKTQGNRKVTNAELKAIFEKECSASGFGYNNVSHYAKQLAENPANISYLEKKAEKLVEKQKEIALEIVLQLDEKNCKRINITELVGVEALNRKNDSLVKKCAQALPEGNGVRTKLAQHLVSEASKKFGEFASIKDGEHVEKALEAVKLLPKGNEKTGHLKKLYVSAKKIEDGLDRRDDLNPSGFYEVKAELNRCA